MTGIANLSYSSGLNCKFSPRVLPQTFMILLDRLSVYLQLTRFLRRILPEVTSEVVFMASGYFLVYPYKQRLALTVQKDGLYSLSMA